MTRIVEHRSALALGTVVEVHVHRDPGADAPVLAIINVTKFSSQLDLESFKDPMPVADAFLRALAYAERAGIACVWIDDPDGHFPPEKRPVHDVTTSWHRSSPYSPLRKVPGSGDVEVAYRLGDALAWAEYDGEGSGPW
jgi:hypothetical protein